jgi:thiamine biosynthesis lipoprotein
MKKISRRDFLKITAATGLALGLGSTLMQLVHHNELARVSETHVLMGTLVNISVYSNDVSSGREAIRKTIAEMTRLIKLFDHRYESGSLAQLNRTGSLTGAPGELTEILQKSQALSQLTDGAFDVSVKPLVDAYRQGIVDVSGLVHLVDFSKVLLDGDTISFSQPGMSLTLDGIAKGRVVDSGVALLRSLGYENVLVEAGGDLMASNSGADAEPWKIGIQHPRSSGKPNTFLSFSVANMAVATSGDYQNSFALDFSSYHIIDPRVGKSPKELSSATVIAATATQADALSTTLMVMGIRAGMELIQKLPGVEALLVDKQLRIYPSNGFPING